MNSDPSAIRLDPAANRLRISWADAHESVYDGAYLRWICPCARCRGHAPGDVEPLDRDAVRDVRIARAETAGTYALRIAFSDGHDTGIYPFEYLRERCPGASASGGQGGRGAQ